MLDAGVIDRKGIKQVHEEATAEANAAADTAVKERMPTAEEVYRFTYAPSEVDAVYPGDYTGLPE